MMQAVTTPARTTHGATPEQPYTTLRADDIESTGPQPSVAELVTGLLEQHEVLVFSKSTCPFCTEVMRTLASLGIQFAVLEVDQTPRMNEIREHLATLSETKTFPNIFVKGESKGGCQTIKHLEATGEWIKTFAPYVTKNNWKDPEISSLGLLWFPPSANKWPARAVAVCGNFFCIGLIIAYPFDTKGTKWAALFLALDFLMRFIWGPTNSMLGMVAIAATIKIKPVFVAGPPKHFASFCGLFMSSFAAALYLADYPIGGLVVILGLFCATGLEAYLDFCMGCWMFSKAIALHLVSPNVYRPYLNLLENNNFARDLIWEDRTYEVAVNEHVLCPNQVEETRVDLIRKNRLEFEYKNQDYSFFRHLRMDLFMFPMTLSLLGLVFHFLGDFDSYLNFPYGVNQTLNIAAAIIFFYLLLIYLIKGIYYPNKVWKEWKHPIAGPFFAAVPMTFTLLGIALMEHYPLGGIRMVWIGGIDMMIITTVRCADLIYVRLGEEYFGPALMVTPVGNFLISIAFNYYRANHQPDYGGAEQIDYLAVSSLWFAVAVFFTLLFFPITFSKALSDHHSDTRNRNGYYIWLATMSGFFISYVYTGGNQFPEFYALYYISFFLWLVLGLGWTRNFFSFEKGDMGIWITPFSLSVYALATATYYAVQVSPIFGMDGKRAAYPVFFFMSACTLGVACVSAVICLMHTIAWIIDGTAFRPRPKWGPVNFMKMTHEAFRCAVPKINTILTGAGATEETPEDLTLVTAELLAKELKGFLVTYQEHAIHEEKVLFPRLRRFFPGLNLSMDEEHERDEKMMLDIQASLNSFLKTKDASTFITALQRMFPIFSTNLLEHLRNEENTITVVARKYLPVESQVSITNEVFNITSGDDWHIILPYVINNLRFPVWQVRFLKTFLWANPANAQLVGLMVYRGVDPVLWLFLAREMPELVPRGVDGYSKMY